jgi:hypothetical protein
MTLDFTALLVPAVWIMAALVALPAVVIVATAWRTACARGEGARASRPLRRRRA